MKITVRMVDPEDEIVADFDARDRRAFERQGRKDLGLPVNQSLQDIVKGSPETYLAWLAWHALARSKETTLAFPQFEERVVGTEMEDGGAEGASFGDPTGPTR